MFATIWDIFGKKKDAWHMILGDNPAGHGFVLRDIVLIGLPEQAPPFPPALGTGVKNFRKVFAGGRVVRNFNFGGEGYIVVGREGGWPDNSEVKIRTA